MSKKQERNQTKELAGELDVFDMMLTSLVELLEEKGVLTQDEWERKIELKKIRAAGLKSYRDIQFSSKR